MGIRYRKSIKVAPGVKINLNRKSASVTVGGKGFHKTYNSNGQTTTSVNLPVKGLSYVDRKGRASSSASASPASSSAEIDKISVPKEKKVTAQAVLSDPPTAGVAVVGFFIIVAGFFLSGPSIPAGIIVALFGVYLIYAYFAHKKNPDSGKYISEGQLAHWRQLLSVTSGTASDLTKKSLPILIELKAAAEEYARELPYSAEDLLNTQQRIIDFSEFVIIKGDNPKQDYDKYVSLIDESK